MLQDDGVRIILVTGDNRITAAAVAKKLGIDQVEAEVMPDRKASVVKRLQSKGRIVAMAGDGINDAPAARTGGCRYSDGDGYRRRHGECGYYAGQGRSPQYCESAALKPRDNAKHPAESVLRFRLQRAWDTDRRWTAVPGILSAAQSDLSRAPR